MVQTTPMDTSEDHLNVYAIHKACAESVQGNDQVPVLDCDIGTVQDRGIF